MKKPVVMILLFISALALVWGFRCVYLRFFKVPEIHISGAAEQICASGFHPLNNEQSEASFVLYVNDEYLYFYRRGSKQFPADANNYVVYRVEDCEAKEIAPIQLDLSTYDQAFLGNSFYYFHLSIDSELPTQIRALNLSTGIDNSVFTGNIAYPPPFFKSAEEFYIAVESQKDPENSYYLHIWADGSTEIVPLKERFIWLGKQYWYEKDYTGIWYTDTDGTETELKLNWGKRRFMSMTDCGLLIHNTNGSHPLYLINAQDELVDLFPIENEHCYTAINLHGTDIYLSIVPWEWLHDPDPEKYPKITGTYKISLEDYSVQKISDSYYNGIYNFDDTCLYVTTETQVLRMDFEGIVTDVVLEMG